MLINLQRFNLDFFYYFSFIFPNNHEAHGFLFLHIIVSDYLVFHTFLTLSSHYINNAPDFFFHSTKMLLISSSLRERKFEAMLAVQNVQGHNIFSIMYKTQHNGPFVVTLSDIKLHPIERG